MRGLLQRLSPRVGRSDELTSVIDHLRCLLNSRKGQSECVEDYGIIDFNAVAHTMPEGLAKLQHSIQQSIERFEPRLQRVRVTQLESDDAFVLKFEVRGRLRSNQRAVRLETSLRTGGLVEVI